MAANFASCGAQGQGFGWVAGSVSPAGVDHPIKMSSRSPPKRRSRKALGAGSRARFRRHQVAFPSYDVGRTSGFLRPEE
jgi:hypothetical protein